METLEVGGNLYSKDHHDYTAPGIEDNGDMQCKGQMSFSPVMACHAIPLTPKKTFLIDLYIWLSLFYLYLHKQF